MFLVSNIVGGPARKEPEDQHRKPRPETPSAFKEPLAKGLTVKFGAVTPPFILN